MSKEGESEPMDISHSSGDNDDIKIEEEFMENITEIKSELNKSIEINKAEPSIETNEAELSIETNEAEPSTEEVQKVIPVENAKNTIDKSTNNNDDDVILEDISDTGEKGNKSTDENKANKIEVICDNKDNKGDFESDEEVIEEAQIIRNEKKSQGTSNIPVSKDSSTFRMHLTKEEIDQMINDGTLEKVADCHYRVRPESVKNLKSTPLALARELELHDIASKTLPVSGTAMDKITVQETTTNVLETSVAAALPASQITTLPIVQQTPLIALMPVNQVAANSNNNAFIALPMQQNSAYPTTLPTFVAIGQSPTQTQTTVSTSLIPTSEIKVVASSGKTVEKHDTTIVASKSTPSVAKSSTSCESTKTSSVKVDLSPKVFNIPVSSGVKRKPMFDATKVKRPYKFAKLADKPKRKSSIIRNIVSDINTSDEEEDGGLAKCKTYGSELASMFFKKIGESKTTNKSLLDKLHKAIFNEPDSDSDQESNSDSDIEEIIEKVKTGKADHHIVNCPGPSKFEASIGPGNNSKLSIVRCQEIRRAKNASYELYKVKVISAGREADTNILIPIPEGYKLNFPTKPREEPVEFSHTPHDDSESLNNVSPLFLEKLAKSELKLRKYKDQIKVLRGRYIELLQEYSNRPQFSTVSDLVGSAAKFLTEDQLVFFLMQLKAGAHNMQGIRYSVREKVLALAIYQKSPEVYKWLSKLFNLPSKRILDQWLEEVGSQDQKLLKKLMYHIYVSYNFKADV